MENRNVNKEVKFTAINDQGLEVGWVEDIKSIHTSSLELLIDTKYIYWVNSEGRRVAAYFSKKGE